jgi:hypothetical protein
VYDLRDNAIDAHNAPAIPGSGVFTSLFLLRGDMVAVRFDPATLARKAYIFRADATAWAPLEMH